MAECDHSRWESSHDYRPLEHRAERQAWAVVALTGVTMLVEIVAGSGFNSMTLLADALTSVAAIVALLGGKLLGWAWLDPLMGVVGALIIAVWARRLLRDTALALLDREMDGPLVQRVRALLEVEPDTEVTDLHLWRVGRAQYACILSMVTHGEQQPDHYKGRLASFPELVHVTVEINRCSG